MCRKYGPDPFAFDFAIVLLTPTRRGGPSGHSAVTTAKAERDSGGRRSTNTRSGADSIRADPANLLLCEGLAHNRHSAHYPTGCPIRKGRPNSPEWGCGQCQSTPARSPSRPYTNPKRQRGNARRRPGPSLVLRACESRPWIIRRVARTTRLSVLRSSLPQSHTKVIERSIAAAHNPSVLPSSCLLKKGDWLRANRFLSGENAQCEVPVPLFQQIASSPGK